MLACMQNQAGYARFVLGLCDIVKAHVKTFMASQVGRNPSLVVAARAIAPNRGPETSARW